MFSLIITVISIALVAALALATLYYGGGAFNKGSAEAEASKILLQGQQLLGAADLYYADHNSWPSMQQLLDGNYLKSVPSAAQALADAHAATTPWTTPIAGQPVFLLAGATPEETCAAVNQKGSLRSRGILNRAYAELNAQCYGGSGSFKVIFKKFGSASSLDDLVDGVVDIPQTEVVSGPVPTDPNDPAWTRRPTVVVGGGGGGGGTGGGGDGGGSGGGGTPVYNLEPSHSGISFGSGQSGWLSGPAVSPGGTAVATWSFVNQGTASIARPTLTLVDAPLDLVMSHECAEQIPAGGSCDVEFLFSPTAPLAKEAELHVTADDFAGLVVPIVMESDTSSPLLTFLSSYHCTQAPCVEYSTRSPQNIAVQSPYLRTKQAACARAMQQMAAHMTSTGYGWQLPLTLLDDAGAACYFRNANSSQYTYWNFVSQAAAATSNEVDVGNRAAGASFSVAGTLTNSSGYAMTIDSLGVSSSTSGANASVTSGCSQGQVLAAGASCSLSVQVTPGQAGSSFNAGATVTLNGIPRTFGVTGQGI